MTQPQNAAAQATDQNTVVSMRNVNKWFGQFHVLRDINLSVDKGERIVVCGPSG
jgi:ABC-type polar amino acid transport system ATPase subunit